MSFMTSLVRRKRQSHTRITRFSKRKQYSIAISLVKKKTSQIYTIHLAHLIKKALLKGNMIIQKCCNTKATYRDLDCLRTTKNHLDCLLCNNPHQQTSRNWILPSVQNQTISKSEFVAWYTVVRDLGVAFDIQYWNAFKSAIIVNKTCLKN